MIYFTLSFLITYGVLVTFRLRDACKEINDQMETIHDLSIRNQELNNKHYPDEQKTDTLSIISGIIQRYIDSNTNDLISYHNTFDELKYLLSKLYMIKQSKKL